MRLFYRARQFWLALGAQPTKNGAALATRLLTPAQLDLFAGMQAGEQAHALQVLHKLLDQGETHPDLLAAALLHDCGKQLVPLNPLERAWVVVVKKLLPAQAEAWGQVERQDLTHLPIWQRSLVVAEQHPLWGAELAQQAGASPLLQALIRRHQQFLPAEPVGVEDELLTKLQVVDNES